MDWEKQDNEIRQHLEGNHQFLPPSEDLITDVLWNKLAQKLEEKPEERAVITGIAQQKNISRQYTIVLVKLSVAASTIALLALLFWWQNQYDVDERTTMIPENAPTKIDATISQIQPPLATAKDENAFAAVDNNPGDSNLSTNKESIKPDPSNVKKSSDNNPIPIAKVNDAKTTGYDNQIIENKIITTPTPAMETTVSIAATDSALPQPLTLAKNAKQESATPKRKVIHLNELNRNAPEPPGFAQKNYKRQEDQAVALQSDRLTPKNNFELKIELTPNSKKTL